MIFKKNPLLLLCFCLFVFEMNGQGGVMDPDDFHGVRTKWLIDPDLPNTGASRHSIIPQLSGLSVGEFVKHIETLGANSITLNLEARNSIKYSTSINDTYSLTSLQINKFEYSCGQRNILLTDFLIDVQKAIDAGEIDGTLKFHVHQRLYPRKKEEKENGFIKDFSNFINLAKARGVDHLIAGIRLGEHGSNGRGYLLDLALKVAREININTDGWLKNNGGLEWSGDAYGRMFKNIHNESASATFFEDISQYTGYFTFCFKAFGIKGALKDAGYQPNVQNDWYTFIENDLGFIDLKTFINNNKAEYPLHANVIYIGDSGDALKQVGSKEYTATTKLFSEAGEGFKGIIGVNGYRRPDKTVADNHLYCFDALEGRRPPVEKPITIKRWRAWPENDKDLSEKILVIAKSGIGGNISPSGPIYVNNGDDLSFDIAPLPGFVIEDVLVNDLSHGNVDQVILSGINLEQNIFVKYKKETQLNTCPMDEELLGLWEIEGGGEFLHFNRNGNYSTSTTRDGDLVDMGVWWFDYDESIPGGENGAGKLIQMDNDDFESHDLSLVNGISDRLTVSLTTGQEVVYLRSGSTSLNKIPSHLKPYVFNKKIVFKDASFIKKAELYSIHSRLVYEFGASKSVVDLSFLPTSVYVLKVVSMEGKSYCMKVVL